MFSFLKLTDNDTARRQIISHIFRYSNFIFSASVHSFNHSTSVHVIIMHIHAKYCGLEHFSPLLFLLNQPIIAQKSKLRRS